jgi:hypothetical protein
MKLEYLLHGRPGVAPRLANRLIRPIPGSMRPVFPTLPPIFGVPRWLRLLFRPKERGKSRVLCSADQERRNTISRRPGPSGPNLALLVHFEFYPTKWLRFEKKFFTNVLRIWSSFLHNFSRLFYFFKKIWIWIPKFTSFWVWSCPIPPNFVEIQKNQPHFLLTSASIEEKFRFMWPNVVSMRGLVQQVTRSILFFIMIVDFLNYV